MDKSTTTEVQSRLETLSGHPRRIPGVEVQGETREGTRTSMMTGTL